MNKVAILALALGSFGTKAVADTEIVAPTIDEGLQLEFNASGLSTLARVIREDLLPDVQEIIVPDIEREVLGIGFYLRGLNVRFLVDSIDLAAGNEGLELKVGLSQLVLSIDSLQVKGELFGSELQQTCRDTQFLIGNQSPVTLRTTLHATVRDRKVILTERQTRFPIGSEDYSIEGPVDCDGQNGSTISLGLNRMFGAAWPAIEPLVRYQVHAVLPLVAEQLTAQANFELPIDLTRFPEIPPQTLTLATFPKGISLNSGSLQITMGANFSSDQGERHISRGWTERSVSERLGSFGINPALLTQAIAEVFPQGTPWFEVDESLDPKLRDFLALDSLAVLWPDLQTLMPEEPYARLKIRLTSAPRFGLDAANQALTMEEPGLELKFMVKTAGEWRDYALLQVDIRSGVIPDLRDEVLSLSLVPDSRVQVSGVFADGYEPSNPKFDQEAADAVVKALLDGNMNRGPIASIGVPPWSLLGRPLALAGVSVAKPLVHIGIYSVGLPE